MKQYNQLPQLNGKYFLTDGGMETTFIFHQGIDLPHFASFDLLSTPDGAKILRDYYMDYLKIAKQYQLGFVLESPTWRASSDWGYLMGYNDESLRAINQKAIDELRKIKAENEDENLPIVISGCIGPRGDGYSPSSMMTADEARSYHTDQIRTLSEAGCDMISAFTINYSAEAIGMTLAAAEYRIPIVIGFTVETDGKLPSGETIRKTIETIDRETSDYPVYYMINCAHPAHFQETLRGDSPWKERIMAIRANASKKSHAELDESEHLDAGDKCELAERYTELKALLPNLKVIGGCCGTDHSHIEEICKHWS
jgi:S-methylmethionine-dependent homocysteine/selenocysteine methylase